MTTPILHIHNATLSYGDKIIFSQLNLDLAHHRWIALLGPSGVGKSSLLRMIAGLSSGNVKYSGNIYLHNHSNLYQQIVYMGQNDFLLPWLNTLENSILGFRLRKHSSSEYKTIVAKAKSLLKEVGLDGAEFLYPHQLSGGMRQRVALVRTLIEDKPIVLMDEPFSAIDAITRYKLQELACDLLQNKTVFFITHDPVEALRLANNIYIMQGLPAKLKLIVNLDSKTPREITHPEIIKLQQNLFHELTHNVESLQ